MIELWSSIYVHGVHIKILIYHMFCWLLVLAPHGDQSELLLCFVGVSASCLSRSVAERINPEASSSPLRVCLLKVFVQSRVLLELRQTPSMATCQPPPMGQDCQLPKNQRLDFQVIQATISSNPFSM